MKLGKNLLNVLRGALIGVAEVIPGVSGGTVALVVGIYERLVKSASLFVSGALALLSLKTSVAVNFFRQVDWRFLLVLLAGMFAGILGGAAVIEPLLEQYPSLARALFAGLILASLAVPFRLAGRWAPAHFLLALLAAAVAFFLTSLPRASEQDPLWWQIIIAAAIAVCALALPGVSGSFVLLTIGFYAPTIAAVNDRDFAYLGLFVVGAIIGLGSFAKLLEFVLNRYKTLTMVLMTGLMAGSLRALWPWQSEEGMALSPQSDLLVVLIFFGIGAAIVASLILVEARVAKKD
jgi:putative membrane protein